MKAKQQSPMWPYLGILACLFVLSLTAPRAWQRVGQKETLSQALASHAARPRPAVSPSLPEPIALEAEYEVVDSAELTARESIEDLLPVWEGPPPAVTQASAPVATQPPVPAPQPAPAAPSPPAPSPAPEASIVAKSELRILPPAPEFSQEVREEIEVANRPTPRPTQPEMEISEEPEPADLEEAEAPVEEPATAQPRWPLPRLLVSQLEELKREQPSELWAQQALDAIHQLCRAGDENPAEVIKHIEKLDKLAQAENTKIVADPPLEARLIRTRYTLSRWVGIWRPAAALDKTLPQNNVAQGQAEGIKLALSDFDALTRKASGGSAWRDYVQLESLQQLATSPGTSDTERRTLARKVLDRLTSNRLTRSQKTFAQSGTLAALQSQLHAWAAEPVTSAKLLTDLDRYEQSGLPSDAQQVANDLRGLGWSNPTEAKQLSDHLDTHYRNANIRVAVTDKLMNRMLPQPDAFEAPVRDRVANVPVYGRSTTFTELSVRLVPDPKRIRMGLEANGLVASDTVSASGPAKFYNSGQSSFLVRKLLVLGPRGLVEWPAIAEAENNFTYLRSLETDFDGVPLVGSMVRSIARTQHDQVRDEARWEVGQKVATRARDQFDEQVRPQLIKAAKLIEEKQVATLNRLGLELTPIALSTTEDRALARLRLGNVEQLGAHTPRPRAPSDSWFSLQVHQSALNNVLEQLDLNGRSFTLDELFDWIAGKLNRQDLRELDDLPDDVRMTFAAQDAVRLRCIDNRLEVSFAFSQLTQGRNRWRDFSVRTYYRPEAAGLEPRFVRDSTIHLDGRSVKGKIEPSLRAIFSRVLSRKRDFHMVPESVTSDPRIKDLQISQFVVEDGWIGLAYSPTRGSSSMARQPRR